MNPVVNVSETHRQIVPVMELGAGLSWQTVAPVC
jgi:hypothetical protein